MPTEQRMSVAQEALNRAESIDGYRAACAASPSNAAARNDQLYTPSFLELPQLKRVLSLMGDIPLMKDMDIAVLHSTAENGYPHTRPTALICMPESSILNSSDTSLSETLCHEAMHIHQRRHFEQWSSSCIQDGWWPVSRGQIPIQFRERCRLNPDTFSQQQFWAWQTHYVPLPLFVRDEYPTLGDVQIKWMDLRNSTVFPDPPQSFKERYGSSPPQPEHPFELLAVEFASLKLQTEDLLMRKLQSI